MLDPPPPPPGGLEGFTDAGEACLRQKVVRLVPCRGITLSGALVES